MHVMDPSELEQSDAVHYALECNSQTAEAHRRASVHRAKDLVGKRIGNGQQKTM